MKAKKKQRPARRAKRTEPVEVEDSSSLTDADWAVINGRRRARERGGKRAFLQAVKKLAITDPDRFVTLLMAISPHKTREAGLDAAADLGFTEEDLKEMVQKQQKPTRLQ